MEPITIATTALTIATPYLVKAGEGLAQKVGEDVWNLIKKPFSKKKQEEIFVESPTEEQLAVIKTELESEIRNNIEFKNELLGRINEAQNELNQQNINNHGSVEKQINIQNNSGNINL